MHEDEPGLTSLVAKGILCRLNQIIVANNENSGWYTLTDYSRKLMLYAFQLRSPRPLLEFQREGVQIEQSTAVELVQLLAQQGWIDKSTKRPRSVVPCSTGSEKIWWRKPLQAVSIAYLQTLAKSEEILKQQPQLHHFQPKGYYTALLHGCAAVLPNQPLAYYQQVMKGKKIKHRPKPSMPRQPRQEKQQPVVDGAEGEEEISI